MVKFRRKWVRILVLAGFVLTAVVALVIWSGAGQEAGPLVAGKPVSHWMNTLPFEADVGFMPYDHPLEQAGPEIIPSLIAVVESDRSGNRFYSKFLLFLPSGMRRLFPAPEAPIHRKKVFAIFRLGQFGAAASNAVPALIAHYRKQTNGFGVYRTIQALGNIGPASEPALPVIVEAFGNRQVPESWPATALLQIGKVSAEAIPTLEREVAHQQGHVAGTAAVAIWAGKKDAKSLERVHSFLRSTNRNVRAHTAVALRYVRDLPEETKVILREMLNDAEQGVPDAAAIALAQAGEKSKQQVSVLIDGSKQGQFQIPCSVALGEMGPMAKEAIPVLKANMETNSPALCRAIEKAVEKISR